MSGRQTTDVGAWIEDRTGTHRSYAVATSMASFIASLNSSDEVRRYIQQRLAPMWDLAAKDGQVALREALVDVEEDDRNLHEHEAGCACGCVPCARGCGRRYRNARCPACEGPVVADTRPASDTSR